MTATTTREAAPLSCPSGNTLLRYREKHLPQVEADELARHLDACPACRADVDSVDFFEAEMLTAQADRAALAGFKPDQAHAQMCWALKDELPAISRSRTLPSDDVLAHLDVCVYCHAQLLVLPTSGDNPQRLPLRLRLLQPMLELALREAWQVVAATVVWEPEAPVPGLVERLRVRLGEMGQVLADGLERLQGYLQPALGTRMGLPTLGPAALEPGAPAVARWELPVPEQGYRILLAVRPGGSPQQWELSCQLDSPADPELARKARLELRQGGELFLAGNLADFLGEPVRLGVGEWTLTLRVEQDLRQIPLVLG